MLLCSWQTACCRVIFFNMREPTAGALGVSLLACDMILGGVTLKEDVHHGGALPYRVRTICPVCGAVRNHRNCAGYSTWVSTLGWGHVR